MKINSIEDLKKITNNPESIKLLATKGRKEKIYTPIPTWEKLEQIIVYRKRAGWELITK